MDKRSDSVHMESDIPDVSRLVAEAQAGNSDSVAAIYDALQPRVYRFFAFRTTDRETAEDLTQTVFLEMIRALPRYRVQTDAKFTTWLFQIARFRLVDHYRKLGRTLPLDEVPEPASEAEPSQDPFDAGRVERALRTLPEKYQTVLHLRFREDFSTEEMAKAMGTSTLNIRVLQHRALRALKRAVEHV